MTDDIKLPPMPEELAWAAVNKWLADAIIEYAVAAIKADRQQREEPVNTPSDDGSLTIAYMSGVYDGKNAATPAQAPSVPECPYSCGWESLHKMAVHDGAYLARTLEVGQLLTDNQRATAVVASIRLIEVCRALLARYGAAQPNAPDPMKYDGKRDDQYVTGWNDCLADMLSAAPKFGEEE